jgi:hypothetical protein
MHIESTSGSLDRVRLVAVLALDPHHKVQCQQPGCGRGIYARVHVVRDSGCFKVLGADCYANHYGGALGLGPAQFGWGGAGLKLTDEQRALLIQNTQALIAQFEEMEARERDARESQLRELQRRTEYVSKPIHKSVLERRMSTHDAVHHQANRPSPWAWQKERTSVGEFESQDGQCWFRVQHRDGTQKLVPWPKFKGWESALPVGHADQTLGAVAVPDIVKAIELLKATGYTAMGVGALDDLLRMRLQRRK